MNEPMFEIKEENKKDNYSTLIVSPLESGYGFTLGNSLRRVLLTSLPGAAVTQVRVSGVRHQFSTLKGMKEDMIDFVLNIKKVRISYSGDKPVKLTISAKGPGEVTAKDIKAPANVTIVNPDLVLGTLAKGAKLDVEMDVEKGAGYSPAEERSTGKIGVVPVDAIFSPVQRVNYKVEETRVGRVTNYDRLILEIWTDGTISPKDSLIEASKILVSYFNQLVLPKKVERGENSQPTDGLGQAGKLSVEEIGLPTRVANALLRAGYNTVEELVNAPRENLVNVKNLGEKSFKIIKLALMERGVEWKNA